MEILKFDIFGKYAFFKNPETNTGTEFSFEHIHKPALLGILGAIVGLEGKGQSTKESPFPKYHQELKSIKLSIVPHKPIFNQFNETITNNTGFANGNFTQVLKRSILQNVKWTIYIQVDTINEKYKDLMIELLQKHESTYPIYLGNNSYAAKVDNVELLNGSKFEDLEEIKIDSIFETNIIDEKYDYTETDLEMPYDLKTYNPIDLNKLQLYKYDWFEYTNLLLDVKDETELIECDNKVLRFI